MSRLSDQIFSIADGGKREDVGTVLFTEERISSPRTRRRDPPPGVAAPPPFGAAVLLFPTGDLE
jgi:hypothetical protein